MSKVFDWIDLITEIKKFFNEVGLPVNVEEDINSKGSVDVQLIFSDIPIEKHGNTYDMNMQLIARIKSTKKNWKPLIEKLQALSERFSNDTKFLFGGWIRINDDREQWLWTTQPHDKGPSAHFPRYCRYLPFRRWAVAPKPVCPSHLLIGYSH